MTSSRQELANELEPQAFSPELGDDRQPGRTDDPLANTDVEALISHPTLGARLQSWADQRAASQLRGKEASIRRQVETELTPIIEQRIRDERLGEYFKSLSQDQLGEALATNPELAADYGRLQDIARRAPAQDVAHEAQVQAYIMQIRTWNSVLDKSDLSAADKAKLDPTNFNFAERGEEGFADWTSSIQMALVKHEAGKSSTARREHELAIEDERNPIPDLTTSPGARSGGLPDLLGTDDGLLLEAALRDRASQRQSRR